MEQDILIEHNEGKPNGLLGDYHEKYYRLMLGASSVYAEECHAGLFIGTDFR